MYERRNVALKEQVHRYLAQRDDNFDLYNRNTRMTYFSTDCVDSCYLSAKIIVIVNVARRENVLSIFLQRFRIKI